MRCSPYVEMGIGLTTDVVVAAVMLWILFQKKARCWLRCATFCRLLLLITAFAQEEREGSGVAAGRTQPAVLYST
jgi:hypothetical protein